MSKVLRTGYFGNMVPYLIADDADWMPGMFAMIDQTDEAYVVVSDGTGVTGMFIDDPTENALAPSGSRTTVAKAQGSYKISHAVEVADSDATRAYDASVESADPDALLYVGADGKLTTASGSYPAVAALTQVPTANNDYTMGIDLRI